MPTRTKIEVNPTIVRRISGLDDLARILFPDNRTHRRVFVAVWVEIKYAQDQFSPSLSHLCQQHDFSRRVLETVRARMTKMGVLKRVSHFNPGFGYRHGWTFGDRFSTSLVNLADAVKSARQATGRPSDEQKDRDSIMYV